MSLNIRKAVSKDIDVLCNLMEVLSGNTLSQDEVIDRLQFIEDSNTDSLFVCEEDSQILGLLGFRIRENLEEKSRFGEISAIVVDPNYRLKGLGRFMMDYAEKLAKKLRCKGMWLVSGFGREEEAHQFYKQLGYQINGYRFVKPYK